MTPHLKVGRRLRLPDPRIFDVSNLDPDGNLITAMMPEQLNLIKGNGLWHADLAFNSRRAGYSILRGHKLPPPNTGGDTEVRPSKPSIVSTGQAMLIHNHPLYSTSTPAPRTATYLKTSKIRLILSLPTTAPGTTVS